MGIQPRIYPSQHEHANHYTIDEALVGIDLPT
jgi:hypothetical protein